MVLIDGLHSGIIRWVHVGVGRRLARLRSRVEVEPCARVSKLGAHVGCGGMVDPPS